MIRVIYLAKIRKIPLYTANVEYSKYLTSIIFWPKRSDYPSVCEIILLLAQLVKRRLREVQMTRERGENG
jgi:hypothetical protein